jgi:hypothetical protein
MNRCVSNVLCSDVFVVCADVRNSIGFRNFGLKFRCFGTKI